MQRIIKNVDPNYFNSRLQGYATRNAQIDYLEGYHLVSDASTYELMPHPGYQNPYILMHSNSSSLRLKVNMLKYKVLRLRLKSS